MFESRPEVPLGALAVEMQFYPIIAGSATCHIELNFSRGAMTRGLGIDLVDVVSLQEQIEHIEGYLEEVFTLEEIECCRSRPNPYECFAARFAAKEALMKALGTGWTEMVSFLKISIKSDGSSVPTMELDASIHAALLLPSSLKIMLSMSHLESCACAIVILEC